MRAWLDPAVPYVVTGPADWDEEVKRQQSVLSEQLVGWREKYPDLRVEPVLMQDRPAHALAQSTGDAQLVVVGSRGRGGLTGMSVGLGQPGDAAARRVPRRRRPVVPAAPSARSPPVTPRRGCALIPRSGARGDGTELSSPEQRPGDWGHESYEGGDPHHPEQDGVIEDEAGRPRGAGLEQTRDRVQDGRGDGAQQPDDHSPGLLGRRPRAAS